MKELIKSYVYYKDKCFFVSTINRECSSPYGGIYAETLIWEWDIKKRERGKLIGQGEGPKDSIRDHIRLCEILFRDGKTEG